MNGARFGDGVGGSMLRDAQRPRRRNLTGAGGLLTKYQNIIRAGGKRGVQGALIRTHGRGNSHAHEVQHRINKNAITGHNDDFLESARKIVLRGDGGDQAFIRPGFSYRIEYLAGAPRFVQVGDAGLVGGNHNEIPVGDV